MIDFEQIIRISSVHATDLAGTTATLGDQKRQRKKMSAVWVRKKHYFVRLLQIVSPRLTAPVRVVRNVPDIADIEIIRKIRRKALDFSEPAW